MYGSSTTFNSLIFMFRGEAQHHDNSNVSLESRKAEEVLKHYPSFFILLVRLHPLGEGAIDLGA